MKKTWLNILRFQHFALEFYEVANVYLQNQGICVFFFFTINFSASIGIWVRLFTGLGTRIYYVSRDKFRSFSVKLFSVRSSGRPRVVKNMSAYSTSNVLFYEYELCVSRETNHYRTRLFIEEFRESLSFWWPKGCVRSRLSTDGTAHIKLRQ